MSPRLDAQTLVGMALDDASFRSWDQPPVQHPMTETYASELNSARDRTQLDEAVITGEGTVQGRRVAVMAGEFSFLAGSIGVAAAERLVRAVERATKERLPLLAAPVSGGTRMQEGTVAFIQMVKITAAVAQHKTNGLPYLVYLRHPTTGGVFASWGSLGHVTVAEPGALIGFLGPRVYEALHDRAFPPGVQVAENLYRRGLIDAVVPPEDIADLLARVLNVLCADLTVSEATGETSEPEVVAEVDAWDSILRSRRDDRPGVWRLLRCAASDVVPLSGTGEGEKDPGLLIALARFGDIPCLLLGQDRDGQTEDRPLGPGALRAARRGMRIAAELSLPLVAVIDTPGAALSPEAEEGGMAGEIARCLSDLITLQTPTLTLLLGQGAGGGALALLPGDRVIAAQHAWLSPLAPEGASAIVHRDTDHAPEMAASQGVRSTDLLAAEIIDRIVPEHPDAAEEPEEFCRRVGGVLREELAALLKQNGSDRFRRRHDRYRRIGL